MIWHLWFQPKADSIETSQTTALASHKALLKVTACSKQWWTPEVEDKWMEYGRIEQLYKQGRMNVFTPKAVRNAYY